MLWPHRHQCGGQGVGTGRPTAHRRYMARRRPVPWPTAKRAFAAREMRISCRRRGVVTGALARSCAGAVCVALREGMASYHMLYQKYIVEAAALL